MYEPPVDKQKYVARLFETVARQDFDIRNTTGGVLYSGDFNSKQVD